MLFTLMQEAQLVANAVYLVLLQPKAGEEVTSRYADWLSRFKTERRSGSTRVHLLKYTSTLSTAPRTVDIGPTLAVGPVYRMVTGQQG